MSRLAVFSNRIPYNFQTGEASAGGLAVAIKASLNGSGAVWIGWSGEIIDDESQRNLDHLKTASLDGVDYVGVPLTREEYEGFYLNYSNGKLWPVMHSMEQFVSRTQGSYKIYQDVNRLFAKVAEKVLKPDDIVSVQDYHMIPLGGELRKLGINNPTSFFSHIPFPNPDFFDRDDVSRKLKEQFGLMITSLDQYDQVGVQAKSDFVNLQRFKGNHEPVPDNFTTAPIGTGRTQYGIFPISIETDEIPNIVAETLKNDSWVQRFIKGLGTRKFSMSADRADFSKNILERIESITTFLRSNPDMYGKVQFFQALPPTRDDLNEYKNYLEAVRNAEGGFQAEFSSPAYSPMQTTFDMIARNRLLALYNHAGKSKGITLISSNFEGQHLGALESIAAQDPKAPSVVVLGANTGAAQQLGNNGPLTIDPYDTVGTAQTILKAFEMSGRERRERHAAMLPIIQANDAKHWGAHALRPAQRHA